MNFSFYSHFSLSPSPSSQTHPKVIFSYKMGLNFYGSLPPSTSWPVILLGLDKDNEYDLFLIPASLVLHF